MNWTSNLQSTQVREHGRLVAEAVLVPGAGWCVRDAAGNWFTQDLVPTRKEAEEVLHQATSPSVGASVGEG